MFLRNLVTRQTHNSDSLVRYAEYFSFAGTGEIAWVHLRVAASSYLSETDSIRIFVWNGGAQPGAVIASRLIKLREVKNDFDLEVDFGRTVAVSGSYYVGYVIYYKNNLSQPQPQFAVEHSAPYALPGQNTAWFHDGNSWKPFTQHPSFPASVSLGISVIMVENSILNGIDDPGTGQTRLNVFPNPFSNSISFSISDISVTSSSLTMYDHSGRVVYAALYRNIFPGILTQELPGLAPGIYHYSLVNDSLYIYRDTDKNRYQVMRLCVILLTSVLFLCSCGNGNRQSGGRPNETAASPCTASRFRIDNFQGFQEAYSF